jgi:hypothetical protein
MNTIMREYYLITKDKSIEEIIIVMVKSRLPRLNPWAFGGAAMITWAVYIILLGIIGAYGWATPLVTGLSTMYIGFDITPTGIIIGGAWAVFDGFFAGLIFALLYNWTLTWCPLIKR